MGIFDSSAIPVLQQVVGFTEARHGVLAGNIANLDTPGYKTRDLSTEHFTANLKKAIHTRDTRKTGVAAHSPGMLTDSLGASSESYGDPFEGVKESFKSVLRHDQSDVSIERQITEMSKNQSMHNMALTIMVSQFRLLETAISERV